MRCDGHQIRLFWQPGSIPLVSYNVGSLVTHVRVYKNKQRTLVKVLGSSLDVTIRRYHICQPPGGFLRDSPDIWYSMPQSQSMIVCTADVESVLPSLGNGNRACKTKHTIIEERSGTSRLAPSLTQTSYQVPNTVK